MPAPRRRENGALWVLALPPLPKFNKKNKNRLCSKTFGGKKGLQTLKRLDLVREQWISRRKEQKNSNKENRYFIYPAYTVYFFSEVWSCAKFIDQENTLIRKEADMPAWTFFPELFTTHCVFLIPCFSWFSIRSYQLDIWIFLILDSGLEWSASQCTIPWLCEKYKVL